MMTWLAVACIGGAVVLVVPSPRARLRRVERDGSSGGSTHRGGWRWLQARPDAPPSSHRMLAALAAIGVSMLLVPGELGVLMGVLSSPAVYVALGLVSVSDKQLAVLREEMPEALDLIGACVQAGSPPSVAVDVVAAISPPATRELLERVAARFRVGSVATHVWEELAHHPVWGDVARDLARSARSGTAIESALRVHADESRRRRHEDATKAARAVGVKSVMPLMLCFLPSFLLVGIVPIIAGLFLSIF